MALSTDDIRTSYPLPVYNYRVEIGAEAVAFSEVAGLSIEFPTTLFAESATANGAPGPNWMYMPGQMNPVKLTLKKGVVRQKSIKALYGWIKNTALNQTEKKDIYIRLCDEKGDPVISWKVGNAFPTRLDAPSFQAQSNDAAVEAMELMADYVSIEES